MSRKLLYFMLPFAALAITLALVASFYFSEPPNVERWHEEIRQGNQVEIQLDIGWLLVRADGVIDKRLIRPHVQRLDRGKDLVRTDKGREAILQYDNTTDTVAISVFLCESVEPDGQKDDHESITCAYSLKPSLLKAASDLWHGRGRK
jgi:hypothetical protein